MSRLLPAAAVVALTVVPAPPASAVRSCVESLGPSLRVTKREVGGSLEVVLAWSRFPGADRHGVVRCDAAATRPCALTPHGVGDASTFTDVDPPSRHHWYRVEAWLDDRYEDNDIEGEARPVGNGAHDELIRCPADPDWFLLDACIGDPLDVSIVHSAAEGDLDLRLYDPLGALVAESATGGDTERVVHVADEAGHHRVEISMLADVGAVVGSPYRLSVSGVGGDASCRPDVFEPNQDALSPAPITPGRYEDLTACPEESDFYAVELIAGQTIDLLVEFTHAEGDIDLNLYDTWQARVAESQSSTDDESITWVADETGAWLVQVFLFADGGCGEGNAYTLEVSVR